MDYSLFLVTKISAVPGFTCEGKWSSADLRLTDSRPVSEILMSCDLFYIPVIWYPVCHLGTRRKKETRSSAGDMEKGSGKGA